MALTADDYTRLGTTAADALASKGTPLAQSLDQIASDNNMTLEQIKRLCEAANNAAFKALFDKSDPTDREVKFDVAKAEDIIARRRSGDGETKMEAKTASFDVMDELRPLSATRGGLTKEAAAPAPWVDPLEQKAAEKRAAFQKIAQDGAVTRMREYLESVASTARFKYASAVDEVAAHFRRLGPDYAPAALETFEKNALAVHGHTATAMLMHVRNALPFGKFAGVEGDDWKYHVVVPQPAFLTEKVASALVEAARHDRAVDLLATPGALTDAVAKSAN